MQLNVVCVQLFRFVPLPKPAAQQPTQSVKRVIVHITCRRLVHRALAALTFSSALLSKPAAQCLTHNAPTAVLGDTFKRAAQLTSVTRVLQPVPWALS
jgi:hypothetical protein